jgi:hypothetical protein
VTTLTGSERAHERRLVLDGAWPHFPILPVVRDTDEGGVGLLVWHFVPHGHQGSDGPWRVYLANLVALSVANEGKRITWGEVLADVPFIEYPDLDEFFDAGWRGD